MLLTPNETNLLANQTPNKLSGVPLEEGEQIVGSFAIQFDVVNARNLKRLRYVLPKSEYTRAIFLQRARREENRSWQITWLKQSNEHLVRENQRLTELLEMRSDVENK